MHVNPEKSLAGIIKLINDYSNISDYSINWNKSVLLPLNKDFEISKIKNNQFTIGNITYLGVHFSPNISDLFELNFTSVLKTTENDLKCWKNLSLSIIGRIATIKMSVLPKINYLFRMIPIQPTKKWFNTLNSTINNFYWKNQKPRIALNMLQKSKEQGGLSAPNFQYYYLAAQLHHLTNWINNTFT